MNSSSSTNKFFYEKINIKSKKITNFLYYFSIFAIIFTVLGLLQRKWGFWLDDGGVLWASKIESFKDLYKIFMQIDLVACVKPSNVIPLKQTFFTAMYRPMVYLFYSWQVAIFKSWAYGYFLVAIALHAWAATFFGYLLNFFFDKKTSFIAALFFGFHASLAGFCIGWITAQFYSYCLFFLILSLITFFASIKNNNVFYYIISILSFLITIFSIETVVFLPVIFLLIYFVRNDLSEKLSFLNDVSLVKYIIKIIPFVGINILYFGVKASVYPIVFGTSKSFSFRALFNGFRYASIATFVADFSNVNFIQSGNFLFKTFLSLFVFIFLFILFYYSNKKKAVLVLLTCGIMLLWPSLIKGYYSRYLYFSLSFFVIVFLFLLYPILQKSKLAFIFFVLLVMFNGTFLYFSLNIMGENLYIYHNAVLNLKKSHEIVDKELCFLFLPNDLKFLNGFAKECWLCGINPGQPIYYDKATFLTGEIDKENDKISIEQRAGKIFFKIKSKTVSLGGGDDTHKMGKLTLVNKSGDETIYEYELDQKYKKDNLLFVIWDAKNKKFLLMNKNVNFFAI